MKNENGTYRVVERCMNGNNAVGYVLQNNRKEGSSKVTVSREAMAFLVGRGEVSNCDGQLYQDKLILKGVGVNMNELPVVKLQSKKS